MTPDRWQDTIAFALAHELAWPRDPATPPGPGQLPWGVHPADPPPFNRLLGPVHARGGLGGLLGRLMNAAQAPAGGGNPALAQQAGARKEHVTGLFVAKGCKLSDVQR